MQGVHLLKVGLFLFGVIGMISCGGDTGTSTSSVSSTSGVITGFGSVFINGVKYETTSTSISTDEGSGASESDLKVGMIVTIEGQVNDDGITGEATTINYEEQLRGPISGTVDTNNQTFSVLGQTIIYDDLTSVNTLDLSSLSDTDILEISGFTRADNTLYATRIEKKTEIVPQYKVQGNISNLNTTSQTFFIGSLTINYASANLVKTTASDLINGMIVRVKGASSNINTDTNTFTVNQVKSKQISYKKREKGSIEGYLTAFTSVTQFEVNGIPVTTSSSTRYNDGLSAGLALNVRVKVIGRFNDSGTLIAKIVKLQRVAKVGIKSTISSIDLAASKVTVLGVEYLITRQTKMSDDSSEKIRFFDIRALSVGDFVKIKGFKNSDGDYVAALLERKNGGATKEVKGIVKAVTSNSIEIRGLIITVNESTTYTGLSGFGGVIVGSILKIEVDDALLALKVKQRN